GLRRAKGIIAAVEEFNLGPKDRSSSLCFVTPPCLDLLHRDSCFLPSELAFTALTVRHANNFHPITVLCVERDGAAGAPDEIARVSRDDKAGFLHGHLLVFLKFSRLALGAISDARTEFGPSSGPLFDRRAGQFGDAW